MKKIWIEDIKDYENQEVVLQAWLYNKRSSGKLHFLQLRDGTAEIQAVVFKGNVSDEVFELADKISQESVVEVKGTVKKHGRSKIGYEIDATDVKVISVANDYPITPKEHGPHFLMEHRHLWLRSLKQKAILNIRHTIIKSVRDFFDSHGLNTDIEIDGGINEENIARAVNAGVNVIVAGNTIFKAPDMAKTIADLKKAGMSR